MRKLFRACIFALGCITAVVITYVAVAFIYSSYIVNYEYELTGWPDETEFGDPMPWKTEYPGKVRILAIQGGALHGLADLEILKALEERSGKRIHELFDFFAGTSTGAVVSALLLDPGTKTGQPVTAHEAIEIYEKFSKDILDTPLHHTVLTGFGMLGPIMQNRGRFDAADVIFGDTRFNELLRPAMFPSFSQKSSDIRHFRNWEASDANLYLKSLVMAVTSVPSVFPAVVLLGGDTDGFFGDPALILNAPADVAFVHARSNLPKTKEAVVVAMGTVRELKISDSTGVEGGIVSWFRPVFQMIARGQTTVSLDMLQRQSKVDDAVDIKTFEVEVVVSPDSTGFDPSDEAIADIRQAGRDFIKDNEKLLDELIAALTADTNGHKDHVSAE